MDGRRTLPALLSTQIASTVGSSITGFGLALWLYGRTGSATWLGVLFLATTLPGILVGPMAGSVVDRLPRRRVMLAADGVAGAATAGAAILHLSGGLATWHLVVVAALISSAGAFQEPAYAAAIATVTPPERLAKVNGIVQLGPALGIVVAPVLAGALLAGGGLWAVLAADLATFLVAIATLAVLRFPDDVRDADAPRPGHQRIREGWSALRAEPGLLTLTYAGTLLNFLFGFVNVLLIPLLLGFSSEAATGTALGMVGVGMVVGSLLGASLGGRLRPTLAIATGTAVIGIGVALAGLRPSVALVGLGVLLLGLPVPVISAISHTLTQRIVAPHLLGRVFGLRRTMATAALPLAHLLAGPLADGVFEPALAPGGVLAGSIGRLVGTGNGRGVAAMFVLTGIGVVGLALHLVTDRRVRALDARVAPRADTGHVGAAPLGAA